MAAAAALSVDAPAFRSMGLVSVRLPGIETTKSEAMPAELAAVTHAALCRTDGGERSHRTERVLRRELGQQVFNMLRSEIRSSRAVLSAMATGLASAMALYSEVRAFLARAWERLSVSWAGGCDCREQLRQAASLLGRFLAGVPEKEAREGFKFVLAEWAASAQVVPAAVASPQLPTRVAAAGRERNPSLAALEDDTLPLLYADDLPRRERLIRARRALALLRRSPKALAPRDVAETLAIVVNAVPEFLAECRDILADCVLKRISVPDGSASASTVWMALQGSPASLRLSFLDRLVEHDSPQARRLVRDDAPGVAAVCAEVAASGFGLAPDADEKEQIRRVLKQLPAACPTEVCLDIQPATSLVLVRDFGQQLGTSAPWLLHQLRRDMQAAPTSYCQADFLRLACCMPTDGDGFAELAEGLLLCWSRCPSQTLQEALLALPSMISSAPRNFCAALSEKCARHPTALAQLRPEQLCRVLDRWADAGRQVPRGIRGLLQHPVELHVDVLDARRLVAASQLLEDCRATSAADLLLLWQLWLEAAVEMSRVRGWGRCSEALREVCRWRDAAEVAGDHVSMPEVVLQDVLTEGLCAVMHDAPLDLGLELGRLVAKTGGPVVARVQAALEERVQRCLQGRGGGMPLVVALAVANGETLVRCVPGTRLWDALTLCVAAQMTSPREVDLFCRSQPCPELRAAITPMLGPWQALELRVRLVT